MSKSENKFEELCSWIPNKLKYNPYGIKVEISSWYVPNELRYELVLTYKGKYRVSKFFEQHESNINRYMFEKFARSLYLDFVEIIIDSDNMEYTKEDVLIHKLNNKPISDACYECITKFLDEEEKKHEQNRE